MLKIMFSVSISNLIHVQRAYSNTAFDMRTFSSLENSFQRILVGMFTLSPVLGHSWAISDATPNLGRIFRLMILIRLSVSIMSPSKLPPPISCAKSIVSLPFGTSLSMSMSIPFLNSTSVKNSSATMICYNKVTLKSSCLVMLISTMD